MNNCGNIGFILCGKIILNNLWKFGYKGEKVEWERDVDWMIFFKNFGLKKFFLY